MEPQVGIAELVQVGAPDTRGLASVYRLDPPLEDHEYVVVSSIANPREGMEEMMELVNMIGTLFGLIPPVIDGGDPKQETFIFACDAHGVVTNYQHLPGSVRGTMDHVRALQHAGYEVRLPAVCETEDE